MTRYKKLMESRRIAWMERCLLRVYHEYWADLLLMASSDRSRRKILTFVLFHLDPLIINLHCGGTVDYNKSERRFESITYSYKGYAKKIMLTFDL